MISLYCFLKQAFQNQTSLQALMNEAWAQTQLTALLGHESTTTNLHHVEGRYLKEVYLG